MNPVVKSHSDLSAKVAKINRMSAEEAFTALTASIKELNETCHRFGISLIANKSDIDYAKEVTVKELRLMHSHILDICLLDEKVNAKNQLLKNPETKAKFECLSTSVTWALDALDNLRQLQENAHQYSLRAQGLKPPADDISELLSRRITSAAFIVRNNIEFVESSMGRPSHGIFPQFAT